MQAKLSGGGGGGNCSSKSINRTDLCEGLARPWTRLGGGPKGQGLGSVNSVGGGLLVHDASKGDGIR